MKDLTVTDTQREMTFGEKAVGLTFNPSNDPTVQAIKAKCADLIDEIHELRTNQPNAEIARMASVAITELQTAQMWAVKAATWKF
jgi:hypothetical protein